MVEIVRDFKMSAHRRMPIPGMPGFLRPVQISLPDAAVMAGWRGAQYRSFLTWVRPAADDVLTWLGQYQERDDDIIFIIEMDTGQPAGHIALYHIDTASNRAQFGRVIRGEGFDGQGLMTSASRVALGWAFARLHLTTVSLEVFADNLPAISLYERLGFRVAARDFVTASVTRDGIVRWEREMEASTPEDSSLPERRLLHTMTLDKSGFYDDL